VQKYTCYSGETGITKDNVDSKLSYFTPEVGDGWTLCFFQTSVADLVKKINTFSDDRNWQRFNTPRNLQLAMVAELGELAEIFQFQGDGSQCMSDEDITIVGNELSDVTIYLLKLAEACSVTSTLTVKHNDPKSDNQSLM
jgi:NTP pyrophosphatase (non-canonical NTP hydrolase)